MNLEEILSQPIRTKIMALLINSDRVEFKELKLRLNITDGNLSRHTTTLEENGYIVVEKIFVGKKPKTLYSVSETGRSAFREYLQKLKTMMEECGYLKSEVSEQKSVEKEKSDRVSIQGFALTTK